MELRTLHLVREIDELFMIHSSSGQLGVRAGVGRMEAGLSALSHSVCPLPCARRLIKAGRLPPPPPPGELQGFLYGATEPPPPHKHHNITQNLSCLRSDQTLHPHTANVSKLFIDNYG